MTDTPKTEPQTESKYRTISIDVSGARKSVYERVDRLSTDLGCRWSDLIFLAVQGLLKNPPTEAPAGSAPPRGRSAGFWVVAIRSDKGLVVGFQIKNVKQKTNSDGERWFPYKLGDDKSKGRAKRGAKEAAISMCGLIPLDESAIKFIG